MKRTTGEYIVLITSVLLLWCTLALLIHRAWNLNEGNFIYATDDNYIFMAMAKNLSAQGHWSADAKSFSSSSSSHLWLLILSSAFAIFGSREVIPFVINFIAATFLVVLVWQLLRRFSVHVVYSFFLLASIILCTPLTSVVLTGQEHTIQIILTITFLYYSASYLSGEATPQRGFIWLTVLAILLTSIRYEGLFLVGVVSVLFAFRKKFAKGAILLLSGLLPVLIYGIFSISKGWYFFPNSIVLKGQTPDLTSLYGVAKFLGFSSLEMMYNNPAILFLFITALVILLAGFLSGKRLSTNFMLMNIMYIGMTFLHMQFARTGSYFRYEAYLVASGLFVTGIAVSELFSGRPLLETIRRSPFTNTAVIVSMVVMMIPLFIRAKTSFTITPTAIMNIYHQQYQMGLFLKEFYNGDVIAANDIGAINYLADVECVDLAGLGSLEVADMMKDRTMSTQKIYELSRAKKVRIAIVYDHWFNAIGGLPAVWTKVGNWTIQRNVNVAGSTVSFYAVDPGEVEYLEHSLGKFSSRLPKSIVQSGEYVK